MADFFEGFSVTPSLNTATPPLGAPEGMALDTINDIMRVLMASDAQIGARLVTAETSIGTYGTLAEQNAGAANITGGFIAGVTISGSTITGTVMGAGNSVAASNLTGDIGNARLANSTAGNSLQLEGTSLQGIYDLFYPVGAVVFTATGAQPPRPSGIAATWTKVAQEGKYVRITELNSNGGTTGGNNAPTTSTDPGHAHGGATGGHALTDAEMQHKHETNIVDAPGNLMGADDSWPHGTSGVTRNAVNATDSGAQSGETFLTGPVASNTAAAHTHTIASDGSHSHTVTVQPEFVYLIAWQRTA